VEQMNFKDTTGNSLVAQKKKISWWKLLLQREVTGGMQKMISAYN